MSRTFTRWYSSQYFFKYAKMKALFQVRNTRMERGLNQILRVLESVLEIVLQFGTLLLNHQKWSTGHFCAMQNTVMTREVSLAESRLRVVTYIFWKPLFSGSQKCIAEVLRGPLSIFYRFLKIRLFQHGKDRKCTVFQPWIRCGNDGYNYSFSLLERHGWLVL